MEEVYKDYPLDKRYKVSNLGNVIGAKGKVLKGWVDKNNYRWLTVNYSNIKVHQMVAETFLNHTRCGHKIIVDHIDNNPQNNKLENLQLTTHRNNLTKDKKNKTSKYTGVYQKSNRAGFRSQVMLDGKMYYLGSYKTEEEAYIAYIDALYEYNQYINE